MQTIRSLTLIEARELGEHVLGTAAVDHGKPVAIVIVNASADLIWLMSMSDTKAPSWRNAYAKAYTAVKFERDTVNFRFVAGDGLWEPAGDGEGWSQFDLANALNLDPLFCGWAGGSLVLSPADGSIMGAIGVSNREELEDHDLASLRPSGWTA